jgi:rod shape determining protein RodA
MSLIDRRVLIHFDYLLLIFIIPIILVSFILVNELSPAIASKQFGYISFGFIVFFAVFLIPIRRLFWLAPLFYFIDIFLLISVKFFGISILGAKRWLEIPLVHITIQPSELMKPALMMMLAYLIHKNPPPQDGYDWKDFLRISFFIMLPFVLIAIEPDLGSATVILLLGMITLFIFGVKWKIWATLVIVFAVSSSFLYQNLKDYQKQRIESFVGDKPSYHIQQSIIAIGSGGLFGKDKDEATQAQLKFLPIATSDFIFAYFVERFGFFGAFVLIVTYGLLILHLIFQGYNFKDDYIASVFTISIGVLLFIYMSVNIAMTMGLAPVVGVPLPLFSIGGSSFINFMILFGIYQNLLAFKYNFFYTK